MPLIVICGTPCSGKTVFSTKLHDYLKSELNESVILINDESLNFSKRDNYSSSFKEKEIRATIRSAVAQKLTSSTYVIVDALNYIKGFRYELYCISRSLRTPHCVCWVQLDEKSSIELNDARILTDDGYDPNIMKEIRKRFEPPNDRNRWDKPLIIIKNDVSSNILQQNNQNYQASDLSTVMSSGNSDGIINKEVTVLTNTTTIGTSVKSSWKPKLKKATQPTSTVLSTTEIIPCDDLISNTNNIPSSSSPSSSLSAPQTYSDPILNISINENISIPIPVPVPSQNHEECQLDPSEDLDMLTISGSMIDMQSATTTSQPAMSMDEAVRRVKDILLNAEIPPPNISTISIPHASADLLYQLDQSTNLIIQSIITHQNETVIGTPIIYSEYNRTLTLHRYVSMNELQRYRRQFVKVYSQSDSNVVINIGAAFLDYISTQL